MERNINSIKGDNMAKKYFTWVPQYWNNGRIHISIMNKNLPQGYTIKEEGYQGDDGDGKRYLGSLEGEFNTKFTSKIRPRLANQSAPFDIELIADAAELQSILDSWYGANQVVYNEQTDEFTDNRTFEGL